MSVQAMTAEPAHGAEPLDLDRPAAATSFDDRFAALFDDHFARLFRIMDRLSNDPALAADLAQDAFLRLYRRGTMPDTPVAWLISVAMNLLRNAKSKRSRRLRLLGVGRADAVLADAPPAPDAVADALRTRERVRSALDSLPVRDRGLLLLRAEGYAYRDIAIALDLNEASIGTLLARAKQAFREAYGS